jgi:hypothetical protein
MALAGEEALAATHVERSAHHNASRPPGGGRVPIDPCLDRLPARAFCVSFDDRELTDDSVTLRRT